MESSSKSRDAKSSKPPLGRRRKLAVMPNLKTARSKMSDTVKIAGSALEPQKAEVSTGSTLSPLHEPRPQVLNNQISDLSSMEIANSKPALSTPSSHAKSSKSVPFKGRRRRIAVMPNIKTAGRPKAITQSNHSEMRSTTAEHHQIEHTPNSSRGGSSSEPAHSVSSVEASDVTDVSNKQVEDELKMLHSNETHNSIVTSHKSSSCDEALIKSPETNVKKCHELSSPVLSSQPLETLSHENITKPDSKKDPVAHPSLVTHIPKKVVLSSKSDDIESAKPLLLKGRRRKLSVMPNLKAATRSKSSVTVKHSHSVESHKANSFVESPVVDSALEMDLAVCVPSLTEEEVNDALTEPAQDNLEMSVCNIIDINSSTNSFVETDSCDESLVTTLDSQVDVNQVHKSPSSALTFKSAEKSPLKSKKQLAKEHLSAKVHKQRIALSKLKRMQLQTASSMQNSTGEKKSDWENLDRNLLCMSDLIYINPPEGCGKELGIRAKLRSLEESVSSVPSSPKPIPEISKNASVAEELDSTSLAPQIRLNEDGSIVLDEESLTIKSPPRADGVIDDTATIYESGLNRISQSSFRRRPIFKAPRWSDKETERFYIALRVVGIDFGLMSAMFRCRNRDELRRKYRLESKKNGHKIDEALKQQHLCQWTSDMFKPFSSSDDEQNNRSNKSNKGKRKRRKLNKDITKSATSD